MFPSPFKTIIYAFSYLPMHTTCTAPLTRRDRNPTPLFRVPPPAWDVNSGLTLKRLPTLFMEPTGSLPCLQESATKFYPRPNTSSPHPSDLKSLLILYSSSTLRIWSSLFPSDFPNDTLYSFIVSSMRDTCPSNPSPFTWLLKLITHTSYEVLHYTLFSSLTPPSYIRLSSACSSQKVSIRFITPCDRPYFMPMKKRQTIITLCTFIFTSVDRTSKGKRFSAAWWHHASHEFNRLFMSSRMQFWSATAALHYTT